MEQKTFDCAISSPPNWFRYRAAAIIVEDGHVLLVHDGAAGGYYTVGGAIHMGETAQEAACREAREETGLPYEVDRLIAVQESFFEGAGLLAGKHCHVLEMCFLMKSQGIKLHEGQHLADPAAPALDTLCYLPITTLEQHNVFPRFLSKWLQTRPEQVLHLVERDTDPYP